MEAVVETKGLTKYYGKTRGIENLDLQVRPGEIFGYLGPNGAGKTTTIRTLLDLIRPTSGEARVLGLDSHRDALQIRRRVGYLPGELSLYPQLTGEQTVTYLGSLRGDLDWAWIRELADRLDFDLTRRVKSLSSGNKQKLGVILALMDRPELALLDEPTKGLDPLMQQTFYGIIRELQDRGTTIFLSSHILPEVERVCDRAGIVREGTLVAVESIPDLKAKALRRIEIQFEEHVAAETFERLEGVMDVTAHNRRIIFTVKGSLDLVVKTAAQHTVVNIMSHEPSLEEVFLAFYTEEVEDVR
jgi:ABC-2 type transport system ATP-binding protein